MLMLGIALTAIVLTREREDDPEKLDSSRAGIPEAAASATLHEQNLDPEKDQAPQRWKPVIVHFHERVPFMRKSGDTVTGITADRLALVFEEAGVPYLWRETPPKRQLEVLKSGRGRHVLLGWFRLSEREAFARFSLPIYRDLPTIVVARSGTVDPSKPFDLDELLGNPALRLLVRDGYSYGGDIDRRILEHASNRVVTTVDNVAMLKMIHAGRADYFFISEEELDMAIESAGLLPGDFVTLRSPNMPPGNDRFILYGGEIEPELIDRVDDAISKHFASSVSTEDEIR